MMWAECRAGLRDDVAAVFVAGTGTDVGKTVVTAALLRALRTLAVPAQAVKPVQTGVPPASPDDSRDDSGEAAGDKAGAAAGDAAVYAAAVADLPPLSRLRPGVCLRRFALAASPHLAAAESGQSLSVAALVTLIRRHWQEQPDAALLLLEAAGGLRVPLNAHEDMLDLMAGVGAPVILVARNGLGALNHVLLSLDALAARGLAPVALVLCAPPPATAAHAAHDAQDTMICADNARFLRRHLAERWPRARLVEVPWEPALSASVAEAAASGKDAPAAWERLAVVMSDLAQSLARDLPHILARSPAPAPAFTPGQFPDAAAGLETRDHAALWHPYASATRLPPLETAARSHDNRIVLADGRELVDGMSSWWAAVHGYNHPHLLDALHRQARRMPHIMFGGLTHAPAVCLGERLLAAMPEGLERIFFADSGSVAVEVALKMALQYQQGRGQRQRVRFLAPRGGYHGDTLGAMSVCDPVNGMHSLFAGLLPRQFFMERPACRFDAAYVPAALDDARRVLAAHGAEIAAVILEPVVQGAGGMWFYHPEYLRGLAELCRASGILLIFDEIATGFGRSGRFFAAEWAGITPDILCCGKALTGGMLTLAATACTGAVAEAVCRDGRVLMHGPTFMANPLACAVAGASLDILDEGRWTEQVAGLEAWLREGLAPCRGEEGVADVRVLGAVGVVEMTEQVNTSALQHFFVQRGVWVRPFSRLIYLMPPYVTPRGDAARLCGAVTEAVRTGIWREQ